MTMIEFAQKPTVYSTAGSRCIQNKGVSVSGAADYIDIRPITSRGDVSDACSIIFPKSAVGAVMAALLDERDGRYGMWNTETNAYVLGDDGKRLEYMTPGEVYDTGNLLVYPAGDRFSQTRYVPKMVNPAPEIDAPTLARGVLGAISEIEETEGDTDYNDLRNLLLALAAKVLPADEIAPYIEEKNDGTA